MSRLKTSLRAALFTALLLVTVGQGAARADQNAGYVNVGTTPVDVAVSPDGARVYSSNQGSNDVSVIDAGCPCVIATVPVGGGGLQNLAVSPDNSKVYVVSSSSNSVRVISTASLSEVGSIPVGAFPVDVAFSPNGAYAYVTNTSSNSLSIINVAGGYVTNTIYGLSSSPRGVTAFNTPAGLRVYTANAGFGVDVVNVINPSTGSVGIIPTNIAGSAPYYLAPTTDNLKIYVSLNGIAKTGVINVSTNTFTTTVNNFGGAPWGVVVSFTPFAEKVYVADRNGWDGVNGDVTITERASGVQSMISLGRRPMGVAANPSGTRVYVATSGRNRVSIIDTTQ